MKINFTENDIINTFRDLHRIPEPGWQEYKTSAYIEKRLNDWGMKPIKCTKTGLYVDINGRSEDKRILYRADIDALPVVEETELPYSSQNEGFMHACGHDFHTTCLLYAAKVLFDNREFLNGSIRAVFQPDEEGDGGALPMIENGVLEGISAAYAIHSDPTQSLGTISYKDGGITACPDNFEVVITGKGGHGANPDKCINPISVASEIVEKFHKITDEIDEMCVISVCAVESGTAYNIIPEKAAIKGTARCFDSETREIIKNKLGHYAKIISDKYGAKTNFRYIELYPPTFCNTDTNSIAIKAAMNTEKIKNIIKLEKGLMIGDDFSYFSEKVPSSYILFGTSAEEKFQLHSSKFKINENSLIPGCNFLVNIAKEFFKIQR